MPTRLVSMALVLAMTILAGCTRPTARPVDLNRTVTLQSEPGPQDRTPLRVAIAAVISPKETLVSYGEMLDYISIKLVRPVQLVQRATYAEVNEMVRTGEVDVALVCTTAFVEGKQQFGMEFVAAPQVDGKAVYYSYLIVPAASSAKRLEDLEGGVFAFTDPLSTTGRLVPVYWLWQIGKKPAEFFRKHIFTYSHDRAVLAVADGLVDGAAVDNLVYEGMLAQNPALADKVRVIKKSVPIGSPPVVVRPTLDRETKRALTDLLLTMDQDPRGKQILTAMRIEKWVYTPDTAYDPIRDMIQAAGRP